LDRCVIAALTLARYSPRRVFGALARMGRNRPLLRRTPGLRFWKLLGSARGPAFGPWDAQRYGLFTVWDSAGALDAFEAQSPVAAATRRTADEVWTVRLAPLRWRGAWGNADPFAGAATSSNSPNGPLAILTRASIRAQHWGAFQRAAGPVSARLAAQPGLIASIGLGEAPLLFQATFSLWESVHHVQAFAYRGPEHVVAIERTRAERWYREELFARFQPIASYGSWNGVDPLAAYISDGKAEDLSTANQTSIPGMDE
jgi:heme-degrading monooxygenase HmoA